MKIKYLGPSRSVNVGEFGSHGRGEVKEYPEDVGQELLASAKKQQFEAAGDKTPTADGDSRMAEMVAATARAVEDGNVTSSGAPVIGALEDILGYAVTAAERDAAYTAWKQATGE